MVEQGFCSAWTKYHSYTRTYTIRNGPPGVEVPSYASPLLT